VLFLSVVDLGFEIYESGMCLKKSDFFIAHGCGDATVVERMRSFMG